MTGVQLPRFRRGGGSAVASFAATVTALFLLLVADVVLQGLRPAADRLSGPDEPAYVGLWPQQWQFFSNYADSDLLTAYQVSAKGRVTRRALSLHAALDDAWGVGAAGDATEMELLNLAESVPTKDWHACEGATESACVQQALVETPVQLVDQYPGSRVCGEYVVVIDAAQLSAAGAAPHRPASEAAPVVAVCVGPK